jgi:hypothetical protein
MTVPGCPQIKLFPDTLRSIGLNPETMPQVNTRIDKRHFIPTGDFKMEALDVGCVFVLDNGSSVEVDEMDPIAAFMGLARNTYTAAFLAETDNVKTHFQLCQRLVRSVPVYRLVRPHSFAEMPDVIKLLLSTALPKKNN